MLFYIKRIKVSPLGSSYSQKKSVHFLVSPPPIYLFVPRKTQNETASDLFAKKRIGAVFL